MIIKAANDFSEIYKKIRRRNNSNQWTDLTAIETVTVEPSSLELMPVREQPYELEVTIKVEPEDPITTTGYASDQSDTIVKRDPHNTSDYEYESKGSVMKTVKITELFDNRKTVSETPHEEEVKVESSVHCASDDDDNSGGGWWDSMHQNNEDSGNEENTIPNTSAEIAFKMEMEEDEFVSSDSQKKVATKSPTRQAEYRKLKVKLKPDATACYICDKSSFSNRTSLMDHIRKHLYFKKDVVSDDETAEHYFDCGVCQKRFATRKKLNLHGKSHSDPLKINHAYCSICEKTVTDKKILQHCIDEHAKVTEAGISCGICNDFTEPDRQKFYFHFNRHREWEEPRLCIICGRYYKNIWKYSHHGSWAHRQKSNEIIVPVHGGKKEPKRIINNPMIACELCGKNVRKFYMKKHMDTIHVNEYWPCPTCDRIFRSQKLLDYHVLDAHEVRLTCHLCGYQAYFKKRMSAHMRKKHITPDSSKLQKRNYDHNYVTCEACGKRMRQPSMKYHMECVHKGLRLKSGVFVKEPEEECGGCGEMFTARKLRSHRQTCYDPTHVTRRARKHKMMSLTPMLNFSCEDCDFAATSESALRTHVVVHATWPCALCNAGFFKRHHYSEHLTKIHKRQLTPELCVGACVDRDLPAGLTRKAVKNYQVWGKLGRNTTPIYDENGVLYKKFAPHLESVTGDLICKFCDASFPVIKRMILHIETKHLDQVEYKCTECGLVFVNEYCYGKHVRKFHAIDYRMVNEPEGQIDSIMRYCNVLGVLKFDQERYASQYARNQRMYEKVKKRRKAARGLPVDDDE